ncbi:Crp/Fnr family transcriptional regulator [Pacificimonas sp. ICDLI1SI03]
MLSQVSVTKRKPEVPADPFLPMKGRLGTLFDSEIDYSPFENIGYVAKQFRTPTAILANDPYDEHVHILERGYAYTFSLLETGRRHISEVFGAGSICNWTSLDAPAARSNINFMAGARVVCIKLKDLRELLKEHPVLAKALTRHELARTMRATQRVRAIVTRSGEDRLIHLLLDLRSEQSASGGEAIRFAVPLKQDELADMIGQTHVHVNRIIRTLEKNGRLRRETGQWELTMLDDEVQRLEYMEYFSTAPFSRREKDRYPHPVDR